MAKRTIQSCWKQYEKLGTAYLAAETGKATIARSLKVLTGKANADDVGASLITLFVRPHLPLDLRLEFVFDPNDEKHDWQTAYDGDGSRILVDPVAVVKFVQHVRQLTLDEDPDADRDEESDLLHRRWLSLLVEFGKLPSIYVMFCLVLQRVAYLLEIAHLEKRGGVVEVAEDEAYHTLLWAFKEFEAFARKTWGLNIRAHYGISWYESEWITGR